jgi:hypothetical protein
MVVVLQNKFFYSSKSLTTRRHSRESGKPDFQHVSLLKVWVPAFAGMTVYMNLRLDLFRGWAFNLQVLLQESGGSGIWE